MPNDVSTAPLADSVPKVDDAIAVGENLEFQRKWWKFERVVWSLFLVILICDVLGLFGRGWLSKAQRATEDNAMQIDYERVVRTGTPSIMTLRFNSSAVRDGQIQVYISNSIVRPLGAQRVSPQPATSTLGNDGITYTFPSSGGQSVVQIALEPSFPGFQKFQVALNGETPVGASILVLP